MGVMFKVNDKELKEVNLRENEYNLEETYDFKTLKKLKKVFIVIDYFVDIDIRNHLPDKRYFISCRESAYHISKEFGRYWDETTLHLLMLGFLNG